MLDWKNKLRPIVSVMAPVAKVVERVADLAVHMQKPSILGGIALASAAVNAAESLVNGPRDYGYCIFLMFPRNILVDAFKKNKIPIKATPADNGEHLTVSFYDTQIFMSSEEVAIYLPRKDERVIEWMRQAVDEKLPAAIWAERNKAHSLLLSIHTSKDLSPLNSKQGEQIYLSTKAMGCDHRAILLTGRPGVGKTTMAQEIARKMDLGRVVTIDASSLSPSSGGVYPERHHGLNGDSLKDSLYLLSPKVIIVDDIDKSKLSLEQIELLREVAQLVIYTANNGEFDDVFDAAFARPGRIDEVFTIEPETSDKRYPFNLLSDEDWDKVNKWPVAYQNEVALRLKNRPKELGLADLEKYLQRRTRSGDFLK